MTQSWFREARYGLMIHWGSYALLGMEAAWPLVWGAISAPDYEALADHFNPQRYDPAEWAALAVEAGMKYAVFTTKHHDGFAMYDTQLSEYSAPKRAAKRDLVRLYVEAFRNAGLRVGLYFTLPDWHHPDYPVGIVNPLPRRVRPPSALPPNAPLSIADAPERWERYLAFMHGQVRELCTRFGQIDLIWFDGHWEHTAAEWRARELVAMIRELQPGIVINDRLGEEGIGDYGTPEQFVPVEPMAGDWETCMTINETWAYNATDRAYKSCAELIATLVEVVSKGGNLLLNVGATADGEIAPEFSSRLRLVGEWLRHNGESIYGAGRGLPLGACHWPTTMKGDALYLHVLGRPAGDMVRVLALERRVLDVRLLVSGRPLEWAPDRAHPRDALRNPPHASPLRIHLPDQGLDPYDTVIEVQLESPKSQ
ncbi:MAG: alpha-L-fucosidase [Chloroflexota bacterium]